jgi:hypothetical protein
MAAIAYGREGRHPSSPACTLRAPFSGLRRRPTVPDGHQSQLATRTGNQSPQVRQAGQTVDRPLFRLTGRFPGHRSLPPASLVGDVRAVQMWTMPRQAKHQRATSIHDSAPGAATVSGRPGQDDDHGECVPNWSWELAFAQVEVMSSGVCKTAGPPRLGSPHLEARSEIRLVRSSSRGLLGNLDDGELVQAMMAI